MDNKLSELSKPVAWRYRYTKPGITDSHGEAWVGDWKFVTDEVNCNPAPNYQKCALYSQEYVSALQHESAVNWEAAASLNVENQELKKRIADLEARLSEMTTFRDNAVKKNERRWEELLELRAKLATPVRLPTRKAVRHPAGYPEDAAREAGYNEALFDVGEALDAQGFTVQGDE